MRSIVIALCGLLLGCSSGGGVVTPTYVPPTPDCASMYAIYTGIANKTITIVNAAEYNSATLSYDSTCITTGALQDGVQIAQALALLQAATGQ